MTTDLATSPTRPGRPPAPRRRRLLLRLLVGALALGLVGILGLAGLAAWFWSQADMSRVWTAPAARYSTCASSRQPANSWLAS